MGNDYKHSEINLNQNTKLIERNTLIATCVLNIILSAIEITFFFLTKSTSILFDGIFSCFMTLTSVVALVLTYIVQKKSFNYPLGKGVFDNIFSLFKNLLTIIICGYFIISASVQLYNINTHDFIDDLSTNNMLFISYTITASLMSVVIIAVYAFSYYKVHKTSSILGAEIKASLLDLSISLAIGISLIVSAFTSNNQIIRENVDKSVTLILVILMTPSVIISFIKELLNISGKRIFKEEEKELREHLKINCIEDIYIIRHNQQKLFMITLNSKKTNNDIEKTKTKIKNHIYDHYSKDTEIYFFI